MAEARLNKEYALRVLGVGVLMLGVCIWSLYDGFVSYPRANQEMEKVRPALVSTNLTAEAWLATAASGEPSLLEKKFLEAGYQAPAKLMRKVADLRLPNRMREDRDEMRGKLNAKLDEVLKSPVYSDHDLKGQMIQAIVTFLLGAWIAGSVLIKVGVRFRADDQGLSGRGFGGVLKYTDLERIEWKQWAEKGIARVYLKDGKKITLDAWHFAGTRDVMACIEEKRPDLKPVVNDKDK